ncbi:transmembrane protein, putative [Medicago truncatula]|uniref:Transmembrane protein, putative n=1 Tax=Medicago truncatula TaxID=3880 RepID=A0A072TGG3_MEDTR|nr:transmembrane protein, putative [Medicago truncatula]
MEEVAICESAQSVLPLMFRIGGLLIAGCPKWIVPDRMQLLCLLILNFCIDCLFGFSIYKIIFFVHVSNFCLDRPFGFSLHRDAHFCLSRLFRSSCILSSIKLGLQHNSYCRDFDLHGKHDLHVIYLREGGGLPLLKCVLKHDTRAKRMVTPRVSLSLMAMMPQHVRDLIGSLFTFLFFSFGYKELKVGREYMRETMLGVMARSSLMEGTGEVSLVPYWQLVRHLRRRSGLDKGFGQTASLERVVETAIDVGVQPLAGNAADFCKATSEATRVLSLSNSAWSVVTSSRMLVDFLFKLICSFILSARVL